jgi:drug/metabolite transporter (DMT)-like permease
MLLLTALIWGMAFVAQKVGMDYVGPLTFIGVRFIIGGIVLLPVIAALDGAKRRRGEEVTAWRDGTILRGGVQCGVFLFIGSAFQQYALQSSAVGKVGFLTAMYIVLVPILGIILKKRAGAAVWAAVAIAVVGMYFLCLRPGELSVTKGDLLALCCAVAFSGQIMSIDAWSPHTDSVKLACVQFFTAGLMGTVGALLTERITLTAVFECAGPLLYAGIMSSGVAYTLQMVAQRYARPTVASLIMSLESVFALLGGWLLLRQSLTAREGIGCGLMFAAVLLSQLPDNREKTAEG